MSENGRYFVELMDIYIPPDEDARIREPQNTVTAVQKRTQSIIDIGQLQPILVEELNREKYPDAPDDKKWKLVDGQVRWLSIAALSARHNSGEEEVTAAFEKWGLRPGHIEVTTRGKLDPITALMMEFHANEDRDDFTWREKGRYVRRIHDLLCKRHGEDWTGKKTAKYINQSESFVSQYLRLTDDRDPATKDEKVTSARSRQTAMKQYRIAKEKRIRKERIEREQKRAAKRAKRGKEKDYNLAARLSTYHGDAREWITKIPDDKLDWVHWDPPYGGREGGGGAFTTHEGIDIDTEYCLNLMQDMVPEIWRVLHDGAWLVMWYTPVHYQWLRLLLQGHKFDPETSICEYCGKHYFQDYIWLSENYSCRKSPHRFWVNPYPFEWLKTDRKADGHEIQRFMTKDREPFLMAGKNFERMPVLMNSNRSHTFKHDLPTDRRHVNHKPAGLLSDILSCISVPGSLGADPGAGSGSIIEAAYEGGRKVLTAEIREGHYDDCLDIATEYLKKKNYAPTTVATWLEAKFTV